MNKATRTLMYKLIESHGENIKTMFNLPSDTEPVSLCKKLFRLEYKAHRLSTQWCNGEIHPQTWEHETDNILRKLDIILDYTGQEIPVFVNGDARGYALKIGDEYIRENQVKINRDWGGYGIIAPDYKHEAEQQLKFKKEFYPGLCKAIGGK